MFTLEDRALLLAQLIEQARADDSVIAAAVVGSLARSTADAWSDIDLALSLRAGVRPEQAARAWTEMLERLRPVSDHLDVWAGPALYRVFLLENSLQVDLSFWPQEHFASTGEPFTLVFGNAAKAKPTTRPDRRAVVGWAWLYALHVRSAIARGRNWQAMQLLGDLRGQVIQLACQRHGLAASDGRGTDRLPTALLSRLEDTLPSGPNGPSLAASFIIALDLLATETAFVDEQLAHHLRSPLDVLGDSAVPAVIR